MRRAIASDFASIPGARVVMTLDARLPDEPGPWSLIRIGPDEADDTWARLGADADWTVLVAPETGGILADCSRTLAARGGRTLGATPEAIELTGDKERLETFLRALGIRTPTHRRVIPAHGLPSDAPYPAVLKPIDGAGSTETYWIGSPEDLPESARVEEVVLLQPYVSGIPSSASFLVGPEGRAQFVGIGRQRVEIEEGRFVYRGGVLPDRDADFAPVLARAVEAVPGLRGFVGVDFLRDQNKYDHTGVTILEINPRPTTSYVGLAQLLPPGQLAKAWIETMEGTTEQPAEGLAKWVRSRGPVTFNADGTLLK